MSGYARFSPYELAFGKDTSAEDVFAAIRAEAESRDVDTSSAQRFLMLGTVAGQLHALRPDATPASTDTGLPRAQAVSQYGALLFQAYRFWETGLHFFTLEERTVRGLANSSIEVGEWSIRPPHESGYAQFPRHLVWGRIDEDAPAEAVDGFFWTVADATTDRSGQLDLLLVLGMHRARPGFSVVEAVAPLPPPPPGHWADVEARSGHADFANILPGGELRDLLALTSVPEVLKFVSRLFHHIATRPECVAPPARVESANDHEHDVRPSDLAARRIRFHE